MVVYCVSSTVYSTRLRLVPGTCVETLQVSRQKPPSWRQSLAMAAAVVWLGWFHGEPEVSTDADKVSKTHKGQPAFRCITGGYFAQIAASTSLVDHIHELGTKNDRR